MPDAVFLELDAHVGIEPTHLHERDKDGAAKEHPHAGEPGALNAESIAYAIPVLVKDPVTGKEEIGSEARVARILPSEAKCTENAVVNPDRPDVAPDARIIPGTRLIETISPQLVGLLNGNGYHQVDAPKSHAQTRAKSATGQEA